MSNEVETREQLLQERDILRRRVQELEAALAQCSEEQTRLEAREQEARASAEMAQHRFAFLAEVSRVFAVSLDYETTLRNVAHLVVPRLSDWCTIDLLDEHRRLQRLEVAHVDPTKVLWAREVQRRYPPNPNAAHGIYNVIRTAEAEIYPEITDELLRATAQDEEHFEILRELGFTSALIVPLVARGHTIGAITMVMAESGRHFEADDLALAEIFARRAALMIDNARLYREATEQREWLRVTLASIGDAVIVTDMQGRISFMNSVAEQLTGWAQDQALGVDLDVVFQLVSEETGAPVPSPVENILRDRVITGLGNYAVLVGKDGTQTPIDDSGAPIFDAQGAIIGVVLVFRDMTERRRAEQALRHSYDQITTILRVVDDGITVQAPTGQLIYANDTAARLCGFASAEELVEAPLTEITRRFVVMDETGQPFPLERLPGRLALQGLRSPEITLRFRTVASGDERWSIVKSVPVFDEHGKVAFAVNTFQDITDIKLTEAALRDQREWLAVTLASIGDAVIATDERGKITFMNAVAEALTGWTIAQAQGQDLTNVFRIINEYTRDPVESPADRVLREGVIVGLANHTILISRDGIERPIDDSGAPIRNERGELIGVVLTFRDITERKQAESALRASEERYRILMDAIPQITWTLAPDGTIDYFNQRWVAYTGLSTEAREGYAWLQVLHPDDRTHTVERRMEAIRAGHPYELEVRMRRADGQYRWHLARILPVKNEDKIIAWIGTATDTHDLKQAEVHQRFLAEASQALTASLDYSVTLQTVAKLAVSALADWCVLHMFDEEGTLQHAAVAHVDFEREQLLHQQLQSASADPLVQPIVQQVVQSGQPMIITSAWETTKVEVAGGTKHLDQSLEGYACMCIPLKHRERILGTVTFVRNDSKHQYQQSDLALGQEFSQRAAIAIDNARLYRQAQHAVHLRDQFLSIASHELRTPLTSLLGNAQLLQRRARREDTLSERNLRAVNVIADQASRLNRMIMALLDISRIQLGQLTIEVAPFDLGALVRRVIAEIQPTLEHHTIDTQIPVGEIIINGDELRLEQVLQNLLQNAIKYSPKGGAVLVKIERRGATVYVSVADQGIGIPEAALPNLFQRFFRAHNVDEQQIGGMGVGLYVVKEIVALHGGEVTVTSKENQGSTFTVRLPLVEH